MHLDTEWQKNAHAISHHRMVPPTPSISVSNETQEMTKLLYLCLYARAFVEWKWNLINMNSAPSAQLSSARLGSAIVWMVANKSKWMNDWRPYTIRLLFYLFAFGSFAWIHFNRNEYNLKHILLSTPIPLYAFCSRSDWIGPFRQRWPSIHRSSMDI